MLLAISLRRIVLPALGGETIKPRCPLPIGARRSMIRVENLSGCVSRVIRSWG